MEYDAHFLWVWDLPKWGAEFDPQASVFLAMTESQQPEIMKTRVSFNMDVVEQIGL